MRKPLIGLTANRDDARSPLSVNAAYSEAVLAAGGIPVLLTFPLSEEDILQLTGTLDGILFTGGGDIHPFFFGEETHRSCGPVFPERDRAELALAKAADAAGLPVLGICRGAQILNVALGGDIFQDIPSQAKGGGPFPIAHRQPFSASIPAHRVHVEPGSLLEKIAGPGPLSVNSLHHQAIRRRAPGLSCCGLAPDGIIEAVWKPEHKFFLGIQWHPERLRRAQAEIKAGPQAEASACADAIFEAFVGACGT